MFGRRNGLTILGLGAALTTAAALIASPGNNAGNAPDSNSPGKSAEKHAKGAKIGEAAPAFTLKGIDGKQYSLADYSGKIVVLEWFNPECPVVVGQHTKGVLKDFANKTAKEGKVVWLAINSGFPGEQGAGLEKSKAGQQAFGIDYPILLDESGVTGRAYGAKTTPHMFVINTDGKLVYAGAIDNGSPNGPPKNEALVNYVEQTLTQLKNNETVSPAETKPYGCGVKFERKKKAE